MLRMIAFAGAGALTAVLAATVGHAANFNSVTAPTIVEMLESQGLPVVTGYRRPSGDPYVRTRASGIDYTVLFYKCKKARRPRPCQHIMYMARYKLERPISLLEMNEWNRRVHFQRGYLVQDRATGLWTGARLEMDVILAQRGWIRAKTLLSSFIVFHRTNRRFYNLIQSRKGERHERIPGAKDL